MYAATYRNETPVAAHGFANGIRCHSTTSHILHVDSMALQETGVRSPSSGRSPRRMAAAPSQEQQYWAVGLGLCPGYHNIVVTPSPQTRKRAPQPGKETVSLTRRSCNAGDWLLTVSAFMPSLRDVLAGCRAITWHQVNAPLRIIVI